MNETAAPSRPASTARGESWGDLIADVIAGVGVAPVFQPIVDLRQGRIVGFEGLARFTRGPSVAPNLWFAEAARRGLVAEFEAAVLRAQLAARADLPAGTFLSVNVEPESLLDERVIAVFLEHAPLDGIVVEVTEHRGLGDPVLIREAVDQLKRRGALIAVDDAGAGYAGLQQILVLEPQILKLDRSLIEGIDGDETKASLVEMLGVFAGRIGATALAEGVETAAEARTTAELGVDLAQGYYFARPAPPWASMPDSVVIALNDAGNDRADSASLRPVLSVHTALEIGSVLRPSAEPICESAAVDAHGLPLVLTRDGRPVGLLQRDGSTALPALVVSVDTSPVELANRVAAIPPEALGQPVVVVDEWGCYLGVVTVGRLLKYLVRR